MLEASSIATESRLGVDFAEIYKSSFRNECNMALVQEISKPLLGSCDICFPTEYPQSSFRSVQNMSMEVPSIYWRNPEYNVSRFVVALIIALLLGSFFWKICLRRDKSTDLISIFVTHGNRSTVQALIAGERLVFYREYAAGMYSAVPYALSQVTVEISYVFFQALCYTLIAYSMMSFQWTATKFIWFFIIIFLSFLSFTYLGMLLMAISPNLQVAGILCSTLFLLFHLFSGFLHPNTSNKLLRIPIIPVKSC